MNLPYGEKLFKKACKKLFQHRTIANTLHRKSTVVFNSRLVHWVGNTPGKSRGAYDMDVRSIDDMNLVTDFLVETSQCTIALRTLYLLVPATILFCQRPPSAQAPLPAEYITIVLK